MAAAALLDNRMAEMATGEGKTLAIALAAAVAALAGMPVHVVTANDYLARRDAAGMAPLFAALGLRVAALAAAGDEGAKRAAYAHDIVYATAKELAFDFLRDRQARAGRHPLEDLAAAVAGRPGPRPVMRGLCLALLDEADSILLDEAEVPLILSRAAPQAARRAFLWQALALARQLAGRRGLRRAGAGPHGDPERRRRGPPGRPGRRPGRPLGRARATGARRCSSRWPACTSSAATCTTWCATAQSSCSTRSPAASRPAASGRAACTPWWRSRKA